MNIIELYQQHRTPHMTAGGHHHTRPGWVQTDCPQCGPRSGKWHLGYCLGGRFFHCWRCGRMPFFETLAALLDIGLPEARKLTRDLDAPLATNYARPIGRYKPPAGVGPLLEPHLRYLTERGFEPDELAALWGLGGISIAARLGWRIFIPVLQRGKPVSWTTRSISDNVEQRYITASVSEQSCDISHVLFGDDYCYSSVIVCEGPFDVFRFGPGAVALLGQKWSNAQLNKLARYPVRVVCLDNEPDTQRRASRLCDALEGFPGETINVVLNSKDPASASEREVKRVRGLLL